MAGASYHLDEGERDVGNWRAVKYVREDGLSQIRTPTLIRRCLVKTVSSTIPTMDCSYKPPLPCCSPPRT